MWQNDSNVYHDEALSKEMNFEQKLFARVV